MCENYNFFEKNDCWTITQLKESISIYMHDLEIQYHNAEIVPDI